MVKTQSRLQRNNAAMVTQSSKKIPWQRYRAGSSPATSTNRGKFGLKSQPPQQCGRGRLSAVALPYMRIQFNGKTRPCQGLVEGSIPSIRSITHFIRTRILGTPSRSTGLVGTGVKQPVGKMCFCRCRLTVRTLVFVRLV